MEYIAETYRTLQGHKGAFFQAEPYPHLVLDNFLDRDFFATLQADMAVRERDRNGHSFSAGVEQNKWISLNASLTEHLKGLVDYLNGSAWVDNLQRMTGIEGLVAASCGNDKLANYHEMGAGGYLGPHVDHSSEPDTGLPHVLNIIVYLSDHWDDQHGGATLFYDRLGKEAQTRVPYRPNRALLFLHTPYSFHCVERIKQTVGQGLRRSLYVDYYSTSDQPYANLPLGFSKTWFKHGTTFILPKWHQYLLPKNRGYTKTYARYLVNKTSARFHRPTASS